MGASSYLAIGQVNLGWRCSSYFVLICTTAIIWEYFYKISSVWVNMQTWDQVKNVLTTRHQAGALQIWQSQVLRKW